MSDLTKNLRELHEMATPGPWDDESDFVVASFNGARPNGEVIIRCAPYVRTDKVPNEANAALIAALRNALPALLDAVDALEDIADQNVMPPKGTEAYPQAVKYMQDTARAALERLDA